VLNNGQKQRGQVHYPQDREEAIEHPDLAIAEFKEMKMRPSMEKAMELKDAIGT
jgi:hypothetical protein